MQMIKGTSVTLHVMGESTTDPFGGVTYEETTEAVDNVLIEPAAADAQVSEFELNGKHIAYILHIPKGDTHIWEDTKVEFYGQTFKTYGAVTVYDADMTPLDWNKKIKVERYE